MVVVKLIGGLGNQLFQYAFSKKIENQGFSVFHDVSDFKFYKKHGGLEIDKFFDVKLKLAPIDVSKKWQGKGYSFGALKRKVFNRYPKEYLSQKTLESINNIPDNCYLDGYWQSSKFVDMAEVSAIKFRNIELNPLAKELLDQIRSCPSISIHVRRGDYLHGNNVNIYEQCGIAYYTNAIKFIQNQVGKCNVYFFSDDHEWVNSQLKPNISAKTNLVNCNVGCSAVFDMYLMSQCNHNIIANSSFSWWAASINPCESKIVVRPKNWYVEGQYNDHDLIYLPEKWVAISNG